MSLPNLIAIGLGFALTAYAILAGADFGAGILDLTCGNSPEQRTALTRTIGPLWEANHVWLIAQSPRLIGTRLTIHTAAATHAALTALAIAGAAVLIAVLPALYLLYVLFTHPSAETTQ